MEISVFSIVVKYLFNIKHTSPFFSLFAFLGSPRRAKKSIQGMIFKIEYLFKIVGIKQITGQTKFNRITPNMAITPFLE